MQATVAHTHVNPRITWKTLIAIIYFSTFFLFSSDRCPIGTYGWSEGVENFHDVWSEMKNTCKEKRQTFRILAEVKSEKKSQKWKIPPKCPIKLHTSMMQNGFKFRCLIKSFNFSLSFGGGWVHLISAFSHSTQELEYSWYRLSASNSLRTHFSCVHPRNHWSDFMASSSRFLEINQIGVSGILKRIKNILLFVFFASLLLFAYEVDSNHCSDWNR